VKIFNVAYIYKVCDHVNYFICLKVSGMNVDSLTMLISIIFLSRVGLSLFKSTGMSEDS
jgi:hypothetical protein